MNTQAPPAPDSSRITYQVPRAGPHPHFVATTDVIGGLFLFLARIFYARVRLFLLIAVRRSDRAYIFLVLAIAQPIRDLRRRRKRRC